MRRLTFRVICAECSKTYESFRSINETIWDLDDLGWRLETDTFGIVRALCPDCSVSSSINQEESWLVRPS